MKLVITGSMGFIGSKFAETAKLKGHKTLGIDKRAGIGLNNQPQILQVIQKNMGKPDMFVHLAGTCSTGASITNPKEAFEDNTLATFNLVEMARILKVPIVYTSTCKAEPIGGMRTPYGATKVMGEELVHEWYRSFGIPYIINRPGTIYGPSQEGSPDSGWVSWFIKASVTGSPITINGDGEQVRDILHVRDYVQLLLDQMENFNKYQANPELANKRKIYPVGGGKENSIKINTLLELLEYTNFNHGPERLGDSRAWVSDNKLVSAVNGWKPKTKWNEGIEQTLKWARKNYKPSKNKEAAW